MSSLIAYATTLGEEEDYFEVYVFPESSRSGFNFGYLSSLSMRGNQNMKLMVVSGSDIMEAFP